MRWDHSHWLHLHWLRMYVYALMLSMSLIVASANIDAIDPSVHIQHVPPRQCTACDIACFGGNQVLLSRLLPPISFVQESGPTIYRLCPSSYLYLAHGPVLPCIPVSCISVSRRLQLVLWFSSSVRVLTHAVASSSSFRIPTQQSTPAMLVMVHATAHCPPHYRNSHIPSPPNKNLLLQTSMMIHHLSPPPFLRTHHADIGIPLIVAIPRQPSPPRTCHPLTQLLQAGQAMPLIPVRIRSLALVLGR